MNNEKFTSAENAAGFYTNAHSSYTPFTRNLEETVICCYQEPFMYLT